MTAGHVMGFQSLRRDARLFSQTRLHRHDLAANDHPRIDLPKCHCQQVEDANPGAAGHRLHPQPQVAAEHGHHEQPKDDNEQKRDDDRDLPNALIGEQHGIPNFDGFFRDAAALRYAVGQPF